MKSNNEFLNKSHLANEVDIKYEAIQIDRYTVLCYFKMPCKLIDSKLDNERVKTSIRYTYL